MREEGEKGGSHSREGYGRASQPVSPGGVITGREEGVRQYVSDEEII